MEARQTSCRQQTAPPQPRCSKDVTALSPISEIETADALASGLQTTHNTQTHARAHTHTHTHTHSTYTHTRAEAAPLVPQLPRVKVESHQRLIPLDLILAS